MIRWVIVIQVMTPWDSNRDCGRRRLTLDLIRLESDAIRSLSSLFELTGTRKSLRRESIIFRGPDLRLADSGEGDSCVVIQIVGLLAWADLELGSDGVW